MEAITINEDDNVNLKIPVTVQKILSETDKTDAKNFRDNPAKWTCKHLIELVNEFEEELSPDQQAGVQLPNNGSQMFQIDGIGYEGSEIVIFYLLSHTHEPVRIVQHITQLNLLLVTVQRMDDVSKPRRKIGFVPPVKESPRD